MYQVIERSYPNNIIIHECEDMRSAKEVCIYLNENTYNHHYIQLESKESENRKRNINANMM